MKDKKKIILIIMIIIILIVLAICGFIIVNKNDKNDNPNGNNPGQNSGENSGNNGSNQGGNSGENPNGGNAGGNSNGGSSGGNQGGNNGENPNGGSSSSKQYNSLSCTRTITAEGVELKESLSLRYHKSNGVQSDEIILTMKSANGGTKEQYDYKVNEYQLWFDDLNEVAGITITSNKLEDRTIFNIKTDYTKLDYSKLDYTTGDGLHPYNLINKSDDFEFITAVLEGSLYKCQKVEG